VGSVSGLVGIGYIIILDRTYGEKITSLAKPWFENILTRIGKGPVRAENHTTSILRKKLIWHAALFGSKQVIDFARTCLAALMQGDVVDPDITKCVMQVGALTGGDQTFDWFERQFGLSDIEHEHSGDDGMLPGQSGASTLSAVCNREHTGTK
jgi:hypothetical protein